MPKNDLDRRILRREENVSPMDGMKYVLSVKRNAISQTARIKIEGKTIFKVLFLSRAILFFVIETVIRKLSTDE